jgi:hypothetical protein
MRYNFKLEGRDCNKIFVIGAGFSLDMFDMSMIDDKSIIISCNATPCKIQNINYFMITNWFSFRKSIMNYIDPEKTKVLMCSKLSPDPCIISDDFLPDMKTSREFLFKIDDLIFSKKPSIINYKTNLPLLEDIKDIKKYTEYMERGIFPCGAGSLSSMFNLAFHLSNIYNIPKIYYVGIDGIQIGNYQYPVSLGKCLQYVNTMVIPRPDFDYTNVAYKDIKIHPNYLLQLYFLLILIGSVDKSLYEKLESLSILSVNNLFNYNDIVEFRNYIISKYKASFSTNINEDGYNLFDVINKDLEELQLILFKDKNPNYIYYQRLKALSVNQKKVVAPEVKK